jgi:hypothetical protein
MRSDKQRMENLAAEVSRDQRGAEILASDLLKEKMGAKQMEVRLATRGRDLTVAE